MTVLRGARARAPLGDARWASLNFPLFFVRQGRGVMLSLLAHDSNPDVSRKPGAVQYGADAYAESVRFGHGLGHKIA
jgi:hypothetical protein